jgi:hypothetical protein
MVVPRSISSSPSRFIPYTLNLLDGTFVFDCELQTVTLLEQELAITEQQRFTEQEFLILKLIFDQYPEYCPLADLLASQSSRPFEQCYAEVQRALNEGYIDTVIRPVRNLLSRARIKLHPFGLDVRSIQETGYMLVLDRSGFKRQS